MGEPQEPDAEDPIMDALEEWAERCGVTMDEFYLAQLREIVSHAENEAYNIGWVDAKQHGSQCDPEDDA